MNLEESKERDDLVAEADDEEDLEDVDDDEDPSAALVDDEEEDEAALEDLLVQRGSRRPTEPDEDDDDIMALASERDPAPNETINAKVIPIKDRQEFVCKRCHLVKARSQLADSDRMLCRDCV